MDRWLARAFVASVMVNVLLAVWLHESRKTTQDVEQRTHDYREARQVRDSARTIRVNAVDNYSRARDVLVITDTVEVERVLTLADSAIAAGERSEAAADSALARADDVISALRRSTKPKLIQPFAEILYSPYAKEYVGRLGIELRTTRNLALVVAGEARKDGPQAYVGARLRF